MLLAVLGTLVALAGYKLIAMSSAFAVDSVRVTGAPPALARKIHAAVEREAHGRNLLSVDRGAIAGSLSDMPYIRSVSVDRAFPHTLAVTVRVEHPSMVVTVGKSDYLVSPDGRVLEMRSKSPAGLPAVSLPAGTTLLVGSTDRRRQRPRRAVGAVAYPRRIPAPRRSHHEAHGQLRDGVCAGRHPHHTCAWGRPTTWP